MKRLLFLLVLSVGAHGDALNQKLIPANTKWLLHVDGEAFRKSRIGAMIIEDKLESNVRNLRRDANTDIDFSFSKVSAVTAFGGNVGPGADRDGVLMIQTTANVRKDLAKLIEIKEAGSSGEPPISKLSDDGAELYKIGEELNLMPVGTKIWLLGKSKTSLRAARAVALGKEPALSDPEFLHYPAVTNAFFFLAVAETGSAGQLPAQAKILQKADGGRVVIGENGDKLFLNLALRSKDTETIAQIQQVVQGLLAFVALSQPDNKDLEALTSSASVASTGDIVSVNLSFPVDRAMKKVREEK